MKRETENFEYKRGGLQKNIYNEEETTLWKCPLCSSEEERKIKTERGILNIVECQKCSLIRVNPRLQDPDKIYHGKSEDYYDEFRLIVQGKKGHYRDKNYLEDLNLIKKYKPSGEFLDIGTNTGSFLRLARNQNWNLTGVEPSTNLAKLAKEWWGLNIINSFLEEAKLPNEKYDIVSMTDVFEHVAEPNEMLIEIKRILKKDGIIFIKVPNGKFNILKYMLRKNILRKEHHDDFDAYEHVCHYSEKTLRAILEKNGFKILQMKIGLPIQIPVWHKYVGQYYQYSSPFFMDWKGYSGRNILYYMSKVERGLRSSIGYLAPNIVCVATL